MERENLFSINMEAKNIILDREEFILRRESAVVAADRERLNSESMKAIFGPANMAEILIGNALGSVSLFMGIFGLLRAIVDYLETKELSLSLVIMAAIAFAVSGICFALRRVLRKKNKSHDIINEKYKKFDELSDRDLGIPSDAKTVEIFQNLYDKDGLYENAYTNDTVKVFKEEEKLCFGYVGAVVAVPIDSIESVVKVYDKITFCDWMKDEPYDGIDYGSYGIVKNKVDEYTEHFSMEGYYSIRFARDGRDYEVLVPLYDMEPVLDILKMPVTQE